VTVTAGERIAASIAVFLVAAIVAVYAIDRVGFIVSPTFVFIVAAAAATCAFGSLRAGRPARGDTVTFAAIFAATLAYLVWLARPSLLPIGSGPDLTHHLMLVDYIEHHWRLPHDPALGAVMGEMADYTPGLHLLAALAGAWTRSDGLHAIYPIVALSIALKAGFVFLIATRLLAPKAERSQPDADAPPPPATLTSRPWSVGPSRWPQTLFAVGAVVMLFAPREYFLRSFSEHSFLAQAVSELFAVAMWWALVAWDERPSRAAIIVFAIAGIGAFLTWPVWIGPLMLLLVALVAMRGDVPARERLVSLAVAGAPIAFAAAIHAAGRMHAAGIVGTAGFVVWPSIEMFTWWFVVLASVGLVFAAKNRRTRSVVWFVAAIALQAAVLFIAAKRSGADRPYLALKMLYLLIYPLSVGAAVALTYVGRAFKGRGAGGPESAALQLPAAGPSRPSRLSRLSSPLAAWTIVAALIAAVGRGLLEEPRPQRVVSTPMYLAGQWARANLPPACIDYLVQDDDSAYWLHLAVLGNARQTDRTRDPATFEPKQALIRWIQPEGLPFAIADNFETLPKDIRTSVDVVRRFGPAAVVKRHGRSTCH
jgi:hypothetical protein